MKPGIELDDVIAKNVFGFVKNKDYFEDGDYYYRFRKRWSPSRHMNESWEVVEKVKGDFGDGSVEEFILFYSSNPFEMPYWQCEFRNSEDSVIAKADTAPLAICLAALKAVGVEV